MEKRVRKLWEIWGEAELKSRTFQWLAVFLGVLLCVQTFVLARCALKPKPVYYVNGAAGLAYPSGGTAEMVKSFAAGFTGNLANYTSATIDACYGQVTSLCSPGYLARIKAGLLQEKTTIENNSVSSLFALENVRVRKNGAGWDVTITGRHSLYAAGREIREGSYEYVLKILRSTPTAGDPFGLVVDDVQGGFSAPVSGRGGNL